MGRARGQGYAAAMSRTGRRACNILTALVALLTLFVTASPAAGQKRPVIGVLSPFIDADSTFLKDLRDGLGELGLRDGREIAIEHRSAEGHVERLPELARELVHRKADVIVTASPQAIRFVQQATRTIPVVMAQVGDAVDQGFVASLARPGGNITGISWLGPELGAKRLELLKEALPGITRVGILREAAAGAASVMAAQTAAAKLAVVASVFEVREPAEFSTALSAMAQAKVEGAAILEGLMITNSARALVRLAASHRIPAIYPESGFAKAGGLMSFGPELREVHRRTAAIVAKILDGTPPGEIPVEQPTRFEFVVNLDAAKALGVTIPPAVLMRADLVLE